MRHAVANIDTTHRRSSTVPYLLKYGIEMWNDRKCFLISDGMHKLFFSVVCWMDAGNVHKKGWRRGSWQPVKRHLRYKYSWECTKMMMLLTKRWHRTPIIITRQDRMSGWNNISKHTGVSLVCCRWSLFVSLAILIKAFGSIPADLVSLPLTIPLLVLSCSQSTRCTVLSIFSGIVFLLVLPHNN